MRIHLHLPRLASGLFWPIAKSGINLNTADARCEAQKQHFPALCSVKTMLPLGKDWGSGNRYPGSGVSETARLYHMAESTVIGPRSSLHGKPKVLAAWDIPDQRGCPGASFLEGKMWIESCPENARLWVR